MKPDPGRFLAEAAQHLMTRTAPAVGEGYERDTASALGVMLLAVAEEFDRAAARRVEENAALRQLFADAAMRVDDTELRVRLEEAAGGKDSDFRVSALERSNAALRGLLIELHAQVETLTSDEARVLEDAIWSELVASTERRRLGMGPF